VRRAGLDYWERVAPRVWDGLADFEAHLPQLGTPFLLSCEAPRHLWEVDFPAATVLVFGGESAGLPRDLRERHAGRLVRIPMADPQIRSLNLSTAVAVTLYEVLRRRHAAGGSPA
jgi:tRNA (cytidine/uridine-2'-O-)-methyltransferase